MALIPTLTLTDSTSFSDEISFSVTDSLAVKAPSSSLTTVLATNAGAATIIVPESTNITYMFIRHTGTTNGTTATAQLVDIEDTDNVCIGTLGANEWCFWPWHKRSATKGVQLQVNHDSIVQMEYAYWTKA